MKSATAKEPTMKATLTRVSLTFAAVLAVAAAVAVLAYAARPGATARHHLSASRGAERVPCPVFIGARAKASTVRHECKLPLV
jgi:hypothetical protein